MNRLLLFSIVLVLFIFYGGKNVPKVMKDNKEILLGIVGGLVLCSFLGMNLEGVQTGSGGEPETLDCEKCIVRALREPQGSVMGIFQCIMGDPESQTPPSCSIDDDALKNCRCDGSVGCPAVTTETPNPSQDACEQAEEMAREASAGDTVAPQYCSATVRRNCVPLPPSPPPAPPGTDWRENIPSAKARAEERPQEDTKHCDPQREGGNVCYQKNQDIETAEESGAFLPDLAWRVVGLDAKECYYSVEDVDGDGSINPSCDSFSLGDDPNYERLVKCGEGLFRPKPYCPLTG